MIDRAPDLRVTDPEQAANETVRDDEEVLDAGLDALRRAIDSERSLLAWVAPCRAERPLDLERLDALLARPKQIVRIEVGLLRPDELAAQLMQILGSSRKAGPSSTRAELPKVPRRSSVARLPWVLLLDGAEGMLPKTAEWLVRLPRLRDPGIQLVLIGRSELLLRRVLSGPLASAELVVPETAASSQDQPLVSLVREREEEGPARAPLRIASVDIEGLEYELEDDRGEPWIVLKGVPDPTPSEGDAAAVSAELIALQSPAQRDGTPRPSWRPSRTEPSAQAIVEQAAPVTPTHEPIERIERSEQVPGRRRLSMILLVLVGVGLAIWGSSLMPEGSPTGEFLSRREGASARPQPGAPPPTEPAAGPLERRSALRATSATPTLRESAVRYEPASRRLAIDVQGMPLSEVLTRIAWQTGLRVETTLDLGEAVDVQLSDLPLMETLERLLVDHLFLTLAATAADEADPRTLWILGRRSGSTEVDRALALLLQSSDRASNEDAARRLEALGRMAAGFGLHDLVLGAEAHGEAESERLKTVRGRVRQTLCRAWSDRAVGPQASSLDCSEVL